MATRIRLARAGRKHLPFYHIGIYDIRQRRDADFIEKIGHYDPTSKGEQTVIDNERASYWLGVGAKPSQTVVSLLKKAGVEIPAAKKAVTRENKKTRKKAAGVGERAKKRTSNSKDRKAKKADG